MNILFERISQKDFSSALRIYNYFITNSTSNFEEKRMTLKKFKILFKKIKLSKLPFIFAKKIIEY